MSESYGLRAVTATDVARVAGVSQSAVSLVLNGKSRGRIGEATVRRIYAVAEEMGYRVNQSARHLRLGATGTALLAVPTLSNNAFASVYSGAAREGARHGLGLVVFPFSAEDDSSPFPVPRQALDGVIACSMTAEAVADVRLGVPLVVLDDMPIAGVPTVTMDVAAGMAAALCRLLELGHRHIAHVRAERPAWTFKERARTFDLVVSAHPDLAVQRIQCPFGPAAARDRILPVLSTADRPTAVVCDDDNMASGVYSAAMHLGLTVGVDVSVLGFNDTQAAAQMTPSLSSVRLPLEELGEHGVRALVELREGRKVEARNLPVEFVERQSVGPVPPR